MRRTSGMTITLAVLAGTAVATLWSHGQAQNSPAGPNYAMVDLERALDGCQESLDVQAKLKARADDIEKRLTDLSNQVQVKGADLTATDPTSEAAYKLREQLDRLQVEFETIKQIEQAELGREQELWVAQGYAHAMQAVEVIARRGGLDMVLFYDRFDATASTKQLLSRMATRRVLYARDGLDVTDELIRELNSQYQLRGGKSSLKIGL